MAQMNTGQHLGVAVHKLHDLVAIGQRSEVIADESRLAALVGVQGEIPFALLDGLIPKRFNECSKPSGSRSTTCCALFSLSLVPMPVSHMSTRPFTFAIRPTHAMSIMLLASAGFFFSQRTFGTTPNISPPSAFQ